MKKGSILKLRSLLLFLIGLRKHSRVKGFSMQPTLQPGDIVIYRRIFPYMPCPKEGSIVLAKSPIEPKNLIIKRVRKKSLFSLDLRGDNSKESTDSRHFGEVNKNLIYGEVEAIFNINSIKNIISC